MSVTDRLLTALTNVVKMNDKIERLAQTVDEQQQRIERLTERVIRLEAQWDTALALSQRASAPPRRIG
jgi:phage shock protein A